MLVKYNCLWLHVMKLSAVVATNKTSNKYIKLHIRTIFLGGKSFIEGRHSWPSFLRAW